MKITKQVLKKMIKEELGALSETTRPSAGDVAAAIRPAGATVAHYATDNKEEKKAPARVDSQEGEEKSVADGDKIDTLRDANKALKRAFERINTRPEIIRTLVDVLMDMENAAEKDTVAALKLVLRDLLKT